MDINFERYTFSRRLKSMLKVDFRRMFGTKLFYIMLGISVAVPILILVMTTMMDGSVSVNPQTGEETVIEAFDSAWQIIGNVSEESSEEAPAAMSMDMMSMCNINLLYFGIAALVCIFTADDFRSGYAKNLFTVRAKKADYIISKTLVCTAGGALLILGFFLGTMLGGAIAGLPFEMVGFNVGNVIMCLLSKMLLIAVFVPIYLLMSVVAKQKLWLSILLSLMVGMFLFMMIPMLSPLNATAVNVLLCLAGGVLLGTGLGAVSNQVLKKTSLV
ncbi:MAG: ABC transporter permease [Oscillospiraceae bacterium]|nr:ABC transporter permease [Oscillospiraceae bacterium]